VSSIDAIDLDDDENVQYEDDDRNGAEDEHLGHPRPDRPQRVGSALHDGRPRRTGVRVVVKVPEVSVDRGEAQRYCRQKSYEYAYM